MIGWHLQLPLCLYKKPIVNFLLGIHKADGHHGLGNSKPDGRVKVVAGGWPCSSTYQLCYRSRAYSVGGQYLYLLVNYGPQNAKWVWLQPQSTAWLLWPQVWVSQAELCSPPSYKRALCAFSPAPLKLCTSQLHHWVHASASLHLAMPMLVAQLDSQLPRALSYQSRHLPLFSCHLLFSFPDVSRALLFTHLSYGCMSHGKHHPGNASSHSPPMLPYTHYQCFLTLTTSLLR